MSLLIALCEYGQHPKQPSAAYFSALNSFNISRNELYTSGRPENWILTVSRNCKASATLRESVPDMMDLLLDELK